MSGIVGLLHLDRSPVDFQLLQLLTDFQAFRGPDARQTWIDGHVGFGHTLLKTTDEAERERQPFSLGGHNVIVADARVDGRCELIAKLKAHGQELAIDAPSAEIILRAYEVWGEDCVQHLLGDFAFGIWDARRQSLFCARDPMGMRPFYYAHIGSLFIFSNTLDCIRQHAAVSDRLNDLAIADFLLFGMQQDPSSTAFADIQRLPAAHTLKCTEEKTYTSRYWALSVTTPILYRRSDEYVEHFHDLLDRATEDRLHVSSAGILMSGGLDSPTVAASARRVLTRRGGSLHAYTQVFDCLIPHEERHYAGLVAEALKIPIEFLPTDNVQIFERADWRGRRPEPTHLAWPDFTEDQLRQSILHSRVVLTGLGADPAFANRLTVHFRNLLKGGQFRRALTDAVKYLSAEGRMSRLYIRTRWRVLFGPKGQSPLYPLWLNARLEKRLGLRERWEALNCSEILTDAVRHEAQIAMVAKGWANLFESYDCGVTRVPIEVYHPFLDLRLVNFLLALPVLPCCSDKGLLREAARGRLPDAVRLRRKSPLVADRTVALLQRPESAWVDHFDPTPELELYVDRSRVPKVIREQDSWSASINLRPLSLNFWLQGAF